MTSQSVRSAFRAPVLLLGIVASLSIAQPAAAQQPLSFFKNYFVPGDYVVRGVSLWRKGVNGKAVAQIPSLGVPAAGGEGVPDRADIVAAFLYIQTAERIQGSGVDYLDTRLNFNGFDFGPFLAEGSVQPGSGTLAKALNWDDATPPCWSVAIPGGRRLVTYRADVLRFLPIDPETGKQSLTALHSIEIPDWGFRFTDDEEGAQETLNEFGPRAIGASLVVVYRDRTAPLRGIVLYDGGATKRAFQTLEQRLDGFYQSLTAGTTAKVTHIVGDGRPFLSERVRSAGLRGSTVGPTTTLTNPFRSLLGHKWDNATSTFPLIGDANAARIRVEPNTFLSDCVSWSAMVLSARVQDSDNDGLLNVWETNPALVDPNGQPLPNLADMGANPSVKDLFIEIGYFSIDADAQGNFPTYGGVPKPPHSHLPSAEALRLMAESFDRKGIKIHFDVGNNYQTNPLPPYIVPWSADPATNLARGGEEIDEMFTVCTPPAGETDPSVCQFRAYPGTVGWKKGFHLLKTQILSGPPDANGMPTPVPPLTAEGDDPCDIPNSGCVWRFDPNREETHHYALFAHSIGLPKDPCFLKKEDGSLDLDALGNPKNDLSCPGTAGAHPDFFVPRTNSGIADFPGGDMLITLGAFENSDGLPIGTDYMQAATLMHEGGHNFELTHAGPIALGPIAPPREPNCKPNYLSVMNYLFQLRGLLDVNGVPQLDFSNIAIGAIPETGLQDAPFTEAVPYRTGWYAPFATSYLKNLANPATKHCDGSDLLPTDISMVRVDSLGLASDGIDWNADGFVNAAGTPAGGQIPNGTQDVNFNGLTAVLNPGANDWASIRLNELGGRRSVGGFFKHEGKYFIGPMSLDIGRGDVGRGDVGRGDVGRGDVGRGDVGRADIGRGDVGRGDVGRADIGRADIGRADVGRGDVGRADIGRGDVGRGDFGGGDMDVGAANEFFNGEIDFETFVAVTGGQAPTPPAGLRACLTDANSQCVAQGGSLPVRLDWLQPNVGRPVQYEIYRFDVVAGAPFPPGTLPATPLMTVPAFVGGIEGPLFPNTTFLDSTAAFGASYAYFVVALFADESRSGISNFATINTPAPVVVIEDVQLSSTTLTIEGPTVSYSATLDNGLGQTLSNVDIQAWIVQGGTRRAAGGSLVSCPGDTVLGDLPPGQCVFQFSIGASNSNAGNGALVPGAATAIFELRAGLRLIVVLDTFTVPVTLVAAGTTPVLLAPNGPADAIAQNDPATGCSLLPGVEASRGRGYMIAFDWQDVTPNSGYRLFAKHPTAALPIVDVITEGSQFTHVQCNSFVPDGNLTGWEWMIATLDSEGQPGEFSAPAKFEFQPCRLDDGTTPCHVPGPPSGIGGITDASGDAVTPASGALPPDLVSGTVLIHGNFVTLQVRFAPGTFNQATSVAQFLLDTDQNPATGSQGTDSSCSPPDNALIGNEFIVNFGAARLTQAGIRPYGGGGCNSFGGETLTALGSVTYLANGMDVTFPRSLIGNDDGLLNFKVTSFIQGTAVLDRMTDPGLDPGVVLRGGGGGN